MNRWSSRCCVAVFVTLLAAWLLVAWPLRGQSGKPGSGSSGSAPPSQPGGSAPTRGPQPGINPQPGVNPQQIQNPTYVSGRILMDNGQPVPEPVSVVLGCGIRPVQVIHTDLKGYFRFTLGGGPQGNTDFSASNSAPLSSSSPDNGMQLPTGQLARLGGSERVLTGCEVQVSIPGYVPLTKLITEHAEITGIELGTLHLTRVAGVTGSSISATSLLVPNGARKEFEKGDKEARNNHPDLATQHLEKAVAQYDKYAAAWNQLGKLYAANGEIEKSRNSFEKAIAADPHYISPYLGLADLELKNQEFEPAVQTAGRALELDPSIGVAHFIQAVGNFKLNRLDAAEKSAQMTEKGPHQNLPDLHVLHAQILLQKQDYSNAAAQMRAYLKEFPDGRFAEQIKKGLEQIKEPDSAQAQIAP